MYLSHKNLSHTHKEVKLYGYSVFHFSALMSPNLPNLGDWGNTIGSHTSVHTGDYLKEGFTIYSSQKIKINWNDNLLCKYKKSEHKDKYLEDLEWQ